MFVCNNSICMATEQALAVYKNKPAIVKETAGDKIILEIEDSQTIKVREKDFEIIHPGPVRNLSALVREASALTESEKRTGTAVREAWELLETEGNAISLSDLADLCFGTFSPASAWASFLLLSDGLFFSGSAGAVTANKRSDVETEEKKRLEKHKEADDRERFLDDLRSRIKKPPAPDSIIAPSSADSRFIQDVQALALGKSVKSKTMKELGLSETPEDAHALLLNAGFWTVRNNPHPCRFGIASGGAQAPISPAPNEERRDLTGLASLAIDNAWTNDPDDAISFEEADGKQILYVHVADPASSVAANSLCEREARDRGVTSYLPEGNTQMFAEDALLYFALGLQEKSPAMTFKIITDESGNIGDIDIFPSLIKARRLSYGEADKLLNSADAAAQDDSLSNNAAAALVGMKKLADRNMRRRGQAGAINIELPEVHITLAQGNVIIEPIPSYRSSDIVRECMLLAGEAAAKWAINRLNAGNAAPGTAFPFVSQEPGDIPADILPGIAGSFQLRRCMRPRSVSIKPSPHWGLGIDAYTQVTSPLRRYTDLLAHIQLRAILRGEKPLSAEEVSVRLAAAEAAAQAANQAERASRSHWTMVYLNDKKDSVWDAIAIEKRMNRWVLLIPAIALETQVSLRKNLKPNDAVRLVLKSVNIPRLEAVFAET